MDEDEFESECMALEAVFCEKFRRENGRKIAISVEPVTPEGDELTGLMLESWRLRFSLHRVDLYAHRGCAGEVRIMVGWAEMIVLLVIRKSCRCFRCHLWRIRCTAVKRRRN